MIAFLSLGSNLGEREENLTFAIRELGARGVVLQKVSPLYETENVGPPAPDYLNCVVQVETALSAKELLACCHEVEAACGRDRRKEVRWGPRVLDIDLLLFGSEQIRESAIEVPHPRMMHRRFVLEPLAALQPELVVPGFEVSVREALTWPSLQREKVERRDWSN